MEFGLASDHATEKRLLKQDNLIQHQKRDGKRHAAETSGRRRDERGKDCEEEGQEMTKPPLWGLFYLLSSMLRSIAWIASRLSCSASLLPRRPGISIFLMACAIAGQVTPNATSTS